MIVHDVLNTDKMTRETAQRLYNEGVSVRDKTGEYRLDTKENAVAFFQASVGGKVLEEHGIPVPYPDIDEEGHMVQNVLTNQVSRPKPSERSLVSLLDTKDDLEDDFTL